MSGKLQQDHFKVTPKKHESSEASPPSGGGNGGLKRIWWII